MLSEKLLHFQVFIRWLHNVVQVTVNDFQIVECANVAFSWNLRTYCDICDCCQLDLLHEWKLHWVIVAPFQGPAFFLFEFQDAASLGVDF